MICLVKEKKLLKVILDFIFIQTSYDPSSRRFSFLKMGRKCCVPGCRSGYASENPDPTISLHLFPKDDESRQKWIRAIPRDS